MAWHNSSDLLYVFHKETDWHVACGDGLPKVMRSLADPSTQHPLSVLLVGKREKEAAERAMFLGLDYFQSRGLAQLYADASTLDKDYPLLITSLDIDTAYSNFQPPRKPFGGTGHRVEWLSGHSMLTSAESLVDSIIGRLVLLFTDVICLFLDDFDAPEEAFSLIQKWVEVAPSSQPWKPRLLLVTYAPIDESMLHTIILGEVQHVRLSASRKKPSRSQYRTLKRVIIQNIEVVREKKIACKRLFSARHMDHLFRLGLQHIASQALPGFDVISATRQVNGIDEHFPHYLKTFLNLCTTNDASRDFILQYIASAIILDSLPPGMHHFNPREAFEALYYSYCYEAFSFQLNGYYFSPADWCTHVEATYCHFYLQLENTKLAASELHQNILRGLHINWKTFRSSRICLFCLRRKPEHPLQCGHACCDVCACIFGKPKTEMDYSYQLTRCILCQSTGELDVRIKPPTAGSRLLVLDGGGVRGALTLQILQALEKHRRLPYPIYDEFDLALGTSTGGMIVLMFLLRREISDCIDAFNCLAKRVFARHELFGNSLLAKVLRFLSSLLTDSLYGATEMEECVKEAYGIDTSLFGSLVPFSRVSGMKVAVTTMAVSNSRLCILSNYNGRRTREGYKHYRPFDTEDEVLVRDAARATSAAPSYFPAKFIRGLGFLQDGGAGKHNNPIDPAEWEARAIWDTAPDIALSIGTGYTKDPDSPTVVSERLNFRDRFFLRLARLFNAILSAQSSWDDHMNRVRTDEKHRYFRINMALEREPALDDVGDIEAMEKLARTFLKSYDLSSITQALFAVSFFFELHHKPLQNRRHRTCHGFIRCRSPDTRALIKRILVEYPAAYFTMEDGTNLGLLDNRALCKTCGLYCQFVAFEVCQLDHSISIFLKFDHLSKHRISGFPGTMSQFSTRQLLDAEFGRPDHRVSNYATSCGCTFTNSRKRKRAAAMTQPNKRRRLSSTAHKL